MIDLSKVEIFCRVAQLGSFTKAANALKISTSKVSRDIAQLEETLGVPLLLRTTRHIQLTVSGRKLFSASVDGLKNLDATIRNAIHNEGSLDETVRITMPEDVGQILMAPLISEFSLANPNVRLDLLLTERPLDFFKEAIDIGLHVGVPRHANLTIKKIATLSFILVASPRWIEQLGFVPKNPMQLERKEFLAYGPRTSDHHLALHHQGQHRLISTHVKISSGSFLSLRELAHAGAGFTVLPTFVAQPYLIENSLIELCPGWSPKPRPLYLVMHEKKRQSPAAKAFKVSLSHWAQKVRVT